MATTPAIIRDSGVLYDRNLVISRRRHDDFLNLSLLNDNHGLEVKNDKITAQLLDATFLLFNATTILLQ